MYTVDLKKPGRLVKCYKLVVLGCLCCLSVHFKVFFFVFVFFAVIAMKGSLRRGVRILFFFRGILLRCSLLLPVSTDLPTAAVRNGLS